jgi:uncharacterized protein YjbI with pentapeptide repeats
MPPDYSGQNLRGRSFKGQNLEGANFSGVDIRGTDFSGANLKGACFIQVKAGLQRRWVILLIFVSWAVLGISAIFSLIVGAFLSLILDSSNLNYQLVSWTCLITVIVLFATIICQGINASLGASIAFALAGTIATTAVAYLVGAGSNVGALATTGAFSATITLALVVAGVVAEAVAGAVAEAVAGVVAVALPRIITVAVAEVIAVTGARTITQTVAGAIEEAVVVIFFSLFGIYIARQALKGDEKYSIIRTTAIAFAAFGGTSFLNADLTDADFTQASLKSTDFRKANLTRTCFHQVKKLDRVRPGTSYLQNSELRQLLITRVAQGKNFENQILQGLNLSKVNFAYANLINTNFYQSSLKEANLEGAFLARAQFESTDLSEARLTGACIEDWVVTKTTKLYGVKCKYIFMKLTEKGDKRDQMPQKGEFINDDFIIFVQSVIDTVKLYHERDVNPSLALYVLQSLSEDYQCTLEIVKVEKRGESGAIIEVKIPGNLNEEQLKETYYEKYNHSLKLYITDPKKQLKSPTNIENVTVYKGVLIGGSVSNSTVAYTIDTKGDTIMSEGSKQQFNNDLRNAQFAGGLVNADKVKAGQIGGDINNYTPQQRQNLAEAAAEIQQLLKQLEETNPTSTETERIIVAAKAADEIRNNSTLKARVIGALKSGSKEAFKEAVDNPLVNILIAIIEGWQEA